MNQAATLVEPRPDRRVSVVSRARRRPRPVAAGVALGVVMVGVAGVAIALHRNGHTQGDDFALYLRQARGIFDGNTDEVVADNRFTVVNSGGRFSPYAYPWGWPLLLSPFVHLWGLDYDRLKLVEVACLCAWLVLVHGIIRRRADRIVALAVTAAVGTVPLLLSHTDQLLSEYPHAVAIGLFVWWLDRISARRNVLDASARDLVVLGVLGALAFNVRRESVILVGVIAAAQLVGAWGRRDRPGRPSWQTIGLPYLSFVAAVVGFQLLMPTMLFPDNGGSTAFLGERLGGYLERALSVQLGLGQQEHIAVIVIALALAGMVVACVRRPRLNVPLAALTVLSALAVSTHIRLVDRYYFQILPWVLYFGTVAIAAGFEAVRDDRVRRLATAAAVAPLLYLVTVHVVVLPGDVSAAQEFDRDGRQQVGPTAPHFAPVFTAVSQHTPPDAVVTFFRARLLTLYTDRRTIQTTDVNRMLQRSDYYAQQRGSTYSQPALTELEAIELGLEQVWADGRWVLWKVPPLN